MFIKIIISPAKLTQFLHDKHLISQFTLNSRFFIIQSMFFHATNFFQSICDLQHKNFEKWFLSVIDGDKNWQIELEFDRWKKLRHWCNLCDSSALENGIGWEEIRSIELIVLDGIWGEREYEWKMGGYFGFFTQN